MSDNKILNLCFSDRAAFSEITKYLSSEDFEGHSNILLKYIEEYYEIDPDAKKCDKDIILSRIERAHPKHVSTFKAILNGFTDISVPNILKEVLEVKKRNISQALSGALLAGKSDSLISSLIKEYSDIQEGLLQEEEDRSEPDTYIAEPVENLCTSFSETGLVKVYPKTLNDVLGGGVPKQTHIVVFASPETGKSLVAINMAAGFCRDGRKTLFIENEDPAASTLMRFVNRMSGMSKMEVLQDYKKAQDRALEKGYGNLVFSSVSPGNIKEIEALIEEHKPECLVVNQIRHLAFRGTEGEVAQISMAGKAMRTLIKKYNLVGISVHQAGASADNKLVLERSDCYMSNTSLPGDADIMLGIGVNDQFKDESKRMFSLVKNKMNGDHSFFAVSVNEQLSKVMSL